MGLPVIAGNNSSIPEVMGKQGIMLKDSDKDTWVRTILELIESKVDPEIQYGLQDERINHARKFSWRKTAESTLEAYRFFNASKDFIKTSSR